MLQGGAPAEAALAALAAYPPATIEPLLENRHRLTPQLATMLADLGDVRAIERLRAVIAEPDVGARVSAAATLARLGDATALPLARGWLTTSDPRLRRGAAEVLVALGAPEAGAAVASLVTNDATRDVGVRLALASPSPAAGAALAKVLGELPEEQRPAAVAAVGRAGAALVPALVKLVDGEELGVSAALALARMPGAEARTALEHGLASAKSGATRRLFVRAGLVRAIELDDAPSGLRAVVKALAAEGRADDASLGVFGLVALGAASASSAVERACGGAPAPGKACAPELVAAAARGTLARGTAADLDAFAPLLDPGRDPRVVAAAGVALLAEDGAARVTTADLVAWTETLAPLAPLAARALAARDTPALRSRIKRLLDGGDPVVRAHAALGLARSAEPDAVSLLVQAYRFEDDAGVRRAIVRGLSRRDEVQRTSTLEVARDLDPDPGVRGLARAALAGRALDAPTVPARGGASPGVAWIVGSSTEAARGALLLPGRVVRADGLAVPIVSDGDGSALVPGLPSGPGQLQMSPPLRAR